MARPQLRLHLIIWILTFGHVFVDAGYKTVCYHESWAVYRRTDSRIGPDFIANPAPCTHLIYAFAVIKEGLLTAFDPAIDLDGSGQFGGYNKFNQISRNSRGVKTLLAVGGWNAGSREFSDMAASSDTREAFAQHAIGFLRQYGFQGLDIDWEYPADRDGSRPEDKENLSSLMQELRSAFNNEKLQPGQERLLLTIATSPHPDHMGRAYEMRIIGQTVDFINIMGYDYARASWSTELKPHNPLWRRTDDTDWSSKLNADWAVHQMIKDGVPAEKIILGIPTYGVTYKVSDDGSVQRVRGSHLGSGDAGPVTKEKGFLAFHEICRKFKFEKNWACSMDETGVPVCHRKNVWLSYESPKSARAKALYIMRNKLGGGMVWSLATDDFNGFCYGKRYPITQTIRDTFDATTKLRDRSSPEVLGEGPMISSSDYCLSDGAKCIQSIVCPDVKRTYLPYELACANVQGKCSYPKIQICDVPKVLTNTASFNKISLLLSDANRAVNLSCASGLSTSTTPVELPVTTVPGKCRKRYLTCEGNLLGGYNVIAHECPAFGEFDSRLQVCKLPDAYDEDLCVEPKLNRIPSLPQSQHSVQNHVQSSYGYGMMGRGGSYAAFVQQTTQPSVQEPSYPNPAFARRPVSLYTSDAIPTAHDQPAQSFPQDIPEQQWATTQPTNVVTVGSFNYEAEYPAGYPVQETQTDPPFVDLFRQKHPGFEQASFAEEDPTGFDNSLDLPPPRMLGPIVPPTQTPTAAGAPGVPSQNQADRMDQPNLPRRGEGMNSIGSENSGLVRGTRERMPAGPRNTFKLQERTVCNQIGRRMPNPARPCSSSFLLCLGPHWLMEYNCATGLLFDETQNVCVPTAQAACLRRN